jgi:hypothetical protein
MTEGFGLVIAGAITAVGAIIVALIQTLRRENHRDHAHVAAALIRLHNSMQRTATQVGSVSQKLDEHIRQHSEEGKTENGDSGRTTRREWR